MPKNIDPAYSHVDKRATARPPLALRATYLKWYDIALFDAPIPPEISVSARDYAERWIDAEANGFDGDYGFVILHRCGEDFYFLLLSVWRGSNELWEAVHFRDLASAGFQPFDAAYPPVGAARPTFCVWELGVVCNEANAWIRLLASSRGDDDLAQWRNSVFAGDV